MIKGKYVLLFILLTIKLTAQDFSLLWEGHFSFNKVTDITSSNTEIYVAAENAIFKYNPETQEINEITTINGLSGDEISTILYSDTYQLLLVGYENGLLEIVDEDNNEVLSVVDILDKQTLPPDSKRINHFNEDNNVVYISTDFGISVFNLERLEFGDTYFISDIGGILKVAETAIFNNFIYASCFDDGLRRADLNSPNLIDFRNWELVSSGNFSNVENFSNNLYLTRDNNQLFKFENGLLNFQLSFDRPIIKLKGINTNLLVTTDTSVYVYDEFLNLSTEVTEIPNFETNFSSAYLFEDSIYLGTTDFGILKNTFPNLTNFEEIHPEGPLLNKPFSVKGAYGNLWVTFGEYASDLNAYPLNSRGFSVLSNDGWNSIPFDDVLGARNLNSISVNPFNINQVFISSFFSGLLEINDFIPVTLYNNTNSGIESLILPSNPNYIDIRVGFSDFDAEGNLWTITSLIDSPLKSFNLSTGTWTSYSFADIIDDPIIDNTGFYDFAFSADGSIFIGSRLKGLIGVNVNSNNREVKNISDELSNLPTTVVSAVAMDNRNQLWIGTAKGLRVLFNPFGFFEDENVSVEEIIIQEDGIARELLFE